MRIIYERKKEREKEREREIERERERVMYTPGRKQKH